MNEVDAVKNLETIRDINRYLIKHYTQREGDVWMFGINVALRITDLLNIRFADTTNSALALREQKTDKNRIVTLNDRAQEIIVRRKNDNPGHIFLFQATSRNACKTARPVTRQHIARAFAEVGKIVGVHLSTHSMRKTRGYQLWSSGVPLEIITKMLNHSSPSVTMRYIGIDSDSVKKTYTDLVL